MINHNAVERVGKQLLLNGKHLADCSDERMAHALQIILLRWDGTKVHIDDEEAAFLDNVFPQIE